MGKLIYCDTNVYLDYFFERTDRFLPLDEFAARVFRRTFQCEFTILISDLVILELANHGGTAHIRQLLQSLRSCEKVREVVADNRDRSLARTLPTHYADALHAAMAIRHKADYIVTSNSRDFEQLQTRIRIASPRSL